MTPSSGRSSAGGRVASTSARSPDPQLNIPFLLRDRLYLRRQDEPPNGHDIRMARPTGLLTVRGEGPYFDGPVATRVAVVDIDAESGALRPGARYQPQRTGRRAGYEVNEAALEAEASSADLETDAFLQVSAFATVLRTMHFFERPDLVGRRVSWAFPSPQLLVIPRAGVMANAFYERETGSLQFFSYPSADGLLHHTVLSSDIVTHETAHAVLDGVAPDLYDAMTPQSLAIHEAIADLTAICLNLLDETIVFSLVNMSGGLLDVTGVLSRVAEEFGSDMPRAVRADFLRAANNARTLDASDRTYDEEGEPNSVDRAEPHALSEVLSGSLYQVFLRSYEGPRSPSTEHKKREHPQPPIDEKRLRRAADRLARLVFSALEFLPPGEVTFADVARSIYAADRARHQRGREVNWLVEELVRRNVVTTPSEITDVPNDFVAPELKGVDLDALVSSDHAARQFAEDHRGFLRIPKRSRFEVLSRHVAVRSATPRRRPNDPTDVVFRVRWRTSETHDLGPEFVSRWTVPMGTTMIVDQRDGRVKSLLSTDTRSEQTADRSLLLRRWVNEGVLLPPLDGGDSSRLQPDALVAHPHRHGQRVTGTGRFLHMLSPSQ
jgi:hypothetical protein